MLTVLTVKTVLTLLTVLAVLTVKTVLTVLIIWASLNITINTRRADYPGSKNSESRRSHQTTCAGSRLPVLVARGWCSMSSAVCRTRRLLPQGRDSRRSLPLAQIKALQTPQASPLLG